MARTRHNPAVACLLLAAGLVALRSSLAFVTSPARSAEDTPTRRGLIGAVAAGALMPSDARAALPSGDAYYEGMYMNRVQDPDEVETAAPVVDESLGDSLPKAVDLALDALKPIQGLLEKDQYEDARAILARPRIQGLGLRISPSRAPIKMNGVWDSQCIKDKGCKETMLQARNSLQLLEEWCFTHRIVYYNQDDKNIIARDMDAGVAKVKKEDISEPLEYLRDGIASLKELKDA